MNKKYAGNSRSPQPTQKQMESDVLAETNTPDDFEMDAKGFLRQGIRSFTNHFQKLAEETAEVDRKIEEVRGKIKRGARRTDGRVV